MSAIRGFSSSFLLVFLLVSLLGSVLGGPARAATPDDIAWLDRLKELEDQVEYIERRDGPFASSLYDPVMALAQLRLEDEDFEAARDLLHRAQNITHRNEGVYTPSQLEAVRMLTEIALAEEDFDEANTQQKFVFFTQQRHIGVDDPASLPAFLELTDWYLKSGQPQRARRLLKDAVELELSAEQQLQLAMLNEKARRLQGLCCSTRKLENAIEAHIGESVSADTLADVYLTYADSLILARKEDHAMAFYRKAAEINPLYAQLSVQPISSKRVIRPAQQAQTQAFRLTNDPYYRRTQMQRMTPIEQLEDDYQPPQWFILDGESEHYGFKASDLHETSLEDRRTQVLVGDPLKFGEDQLNFILPLSLQAPEARANLSVELAFTVTETGDLDDIEVVESNAPIKIERLLVASLKKVYFRPMIIDGEARRRDNVRIIQTFNSQYTGDAL